MKLKNIKNFLPDTDLKSNISKGNKSLNPKELFGIWKNSPRNIEGIRDGSWSFKN
jgi:hypothetical protein